MPFNSNSLHSECPCPFHGSLVEPRSLCLVEEGMFALLPRCPRDQAARLEHILAILVNGVILYIKVLSNTFDKLYMHDCTNYHFQTSLELIHFLEGDRLELHFSNHLSVRPKWHCTSGMDNLPPHQSWFHPGISSSQARELIAHQPIGTFLIYPRRQFDAPMALCIIGEDNQVACFRIQVRRIALDRSYFIDSYKAFSSIAELVNFYRSRSLTDTNQRRYPLKQPLVSTAFVARVAGQRVENELLPRNGIKEEFSNILMLPKASNDMKSVALLPQNAGKNRYKNVLPFDSTRVELGDQGAYINASWIQVDDPGDPDRPFRYIASQGPLDSTRGDFWYMVWQEGCKVIIMATREVENRVKKCQRYWPTKAEAIFDFQSSTGDRMLVRFVCENRSSQLTDTEIELENLAQIDAARSIRLLRFNNWPDHGAPRDTTTVLNLLKKANDINKESHMQISTPLPPLLIHCSAGLGRTGCIIAIDSIVQLVERHGLDKAVLDIFKTVTSMRRDREGMVQNLAQYQFIYSTVVMHIDSKLRPLLPSELPHFESPLSIRSKLSSCGNSY